MQELSQPLLVLGGLPDASHQLHTSENGSDVPETVLHSRLGLALRHTYALRRPVSLARGHPDPAGLAGIQCDFADQSITAAGRTHTFSCDILLLRYWMNETIRMRNVMLY